MNRETQERLNAINRAFYQRAAADFDATRQRAWAGWTPLLDLLELPITSVFDIGCGNGRFALFLAQKQAANFAYFGLDSNAALLAAACQQLAARPQIQVELRAQDLILAGLPRQKAQLVVLFGLLHHVPGYAQRRKLLAAAADCVLPGGYLVFTAWRFYEEDRFRQRIRPWAGDIAVEKNDFLLDWRRGQRALRYCHYIDDAEQAQLITAAGLPVRADYRADGASGQLNRYTVLQREAERA